MLEDLYADPNWVVDHLEDNLETISMLVHRLISNLPSMRFYSTTVPDMPDGQLIAFIRGGGRVFFYVERESGIYAREIPNAKLKDFVFTPLVFDLDLGSGINSDSL